MVSSRSSIFSTDRLCTAGPQGSGAVGHPHQQHQRQSEWPACSGTAEGKFLYLIVLYEIKVILIFYEKPLFKWVLVYGYNKNPDPSLSGLELWSEAYVSLQ